ncbi:uncharacterized protein LOC132850357 [Tachysurus vachellii]|uniref:uncharacterized protein LOC132850357 n=1 Tax=Tachysurus vachellii TaxID=175792 RepID=UPI00296AB782|nr:uncharacterized protein LOC132850357 [Tachysurus vachellii]
MSATLSIIQFDYQSHKEFICSKTIKKKHSAVCKFCSASFTETKGTTSNFHRHVERKQKERLAEYKRGIHSESNRTATQSIESSFCHAAPHYSPDSSRQKSNQPSNRQRLDYWLYLTVIYTVVENEHFRHFLYTLDLKYVPMSSMTITEKCIPDLIGKVKMHICETLKKHSSISVTDIWSDRTLCSFLGINAHVCNTSEDVYKLDSFLLDCRYFPSRHTGENIAMAFDDITEEYEITNKIDYILTDNAANMKCAFKVKLPQQSVDPAIDSEEEIDNLDDEELWEDVDIMQEIAIDIIASSRQRLSCFAHSLQLVIGDGLKEAKISGHSKSIQAYLFTAQQHYFQEPL